MSRQIVEVVGRNIAISGNNNFLHYFRLRNANALQVSIYGCSRNAD